MFGAKEQANLVYFSFLSLGMICSLISSGPIRFEVVDILSRPLGSHVTQRMWFLW